MLGRYAKAGVLLAACVVLAIEAYLLFGYYDRYYDSGAAPDTVANSVAAPEETTLRYTGDSDRSAGPGISEGTGSGPKQELGNDDFAGATTFTHTATDKNSRGDYTYLSDQGIDGDPNAIVLVTLPQDRENSGGTYDHNIGVWYEPGAKKWAIFNQDRAAVPPGAVFKVTVPRESDGFVHRSEVPNIVGNSTYLDDPLTNGEPDAAVSVTQNWNPGGGGGIYNDHPVGVLYDANVEKWSIYNIDGARMPDRAAFNVAVLGGAEPAR
ncbi:MAG: hypothetical protein M3151_14430 [Actinomycetota bacterium]|nr:hypothetical protein [Actinomycetota bacterium]